MRFPCRRPPFVIAARAASRGEGQSCPGPLRTDAELPELPDVERFRRVLTKGALRKTIGQVVVSDVRILGKLPVQTFISRLQGAKLVEVRRHGKLDFVDDGSLA